MITNFSPYKNTVSCNTAMAENNDAQSQKNELSQADTNCGTSAVNDASSNKPTNIGNKTVSPFDKFKQLDRQNSSKGIQPSSPKTPTTPGAENVLFKVTDPEVARNVLSIKERLLHWCQSKTKEYTNIKIDNFSTSWADGMAFCALIHHFLPNAFDYHRLNPKNRRRNFTLAFQIADKEAGIAPLLDVEDMVIMRKPDWKCVFTYVQSIYRRFKDED